MITLSGTRFGEIEVDEGGTVAFPRGLFGFADAKRFVLLEQRAGKPVAWLQSLDFPELAFPVMEGASFGPMYPEPSPPQLANEAGLGNTQEVAVLVVVAANGPSRLVANLLAPLVIDLEKRVGAQVVLDHRRFSPAAPVIAA